MEQFSESVADLLGEVRGNIEMLQKAISEVDHVKLNLKTTASDLKSHIRDSFSRHLEALRNRETWLLGQVEVVQQAKEGVLQQQQAELNKALGRLQSACELLEQSGQVLDTESLECHARECLMVAGGLDLAPNESKKITFLGQNFELQEFIQKFGVVVSDSPVVKEQMGSEVLSQKTTFFTPSGSCEEWLMKSNGTSTSQDLLRIPSVKLNIQEWLQQKTVSAVSTVEEISFYSPDQHPIEHWLSKGPSMNSTPETPKIVPSPEPKPSDNQAWLLDSSRIRSSTAVMPADLFSYYRMVKMSKSSQWLKKSGITEGELSTSLIGDTYRKIASSSADTWLKKKARSTGSTTFSRSMSTQSCSDCSCGLMSECYDSDAQGRSTEFDDTSSELSDWFAVQKEDVETSSGIVASPGKAHNNDQWLLKQSCTKADVTTQDYTGIKSYKENLAAQPNQQWLYPSIEDHVTDSELTSSGMKSYIESLPVDNKHWLSNPSTDKEDLCKWLAGSSSQRCKECPVMCYKGVFKVFEQIASTKDGWLLTQPELY